MNTINRRLPHPRIRVHTATALVLLAMLAGCATVPQPLKGSYVTVTPRQAASGTYDGTPVRWGGDIIKTQPLKGKTCFYVLSHRLGDNARPLATDQSQGRFIACHAGFYDPEVFTKGREITVTGTIDGTQTGKVGHYSYTYPRLAAHAIHLWAKRPPPVRYVPAPYYDPFWGYPAWGPYPWGPRWWY